MRGAGGGGSWCQYCLSLQTKQSTAVGARGRAVHWEVRVSFPALSVSFVLWPRGQCAELRQDACSSAGWAGAAAGFCGCPLTQLVGCSASTAGVWVQVVCMSEEHVGCQILPGRL